jgi:pimeloyl-ACP methyl ester carboxylesterase
MGTRGRVDVGGVELEVEVLGDGEPVVVVQTALGADELRPLAEQLAAGGRYRVIHYHRRGYAGSGPVVGDSSVLRDATDCRRVLEALGETSAHVVGASYSAAVALTSASSAPQAVRTVTAIEPPPVGVPSAGEFRAANARLLRTFGSSGPTVALEELMTMLVGADWRRESERDQPGSVAAMERDAATFFEHDVPALLLWRFGAEEAVGIRCPVMYIGGTDSGPWFAEMRTHLLRLLPRAESAAVAGGGHLLAYTHPSETARLVSAFIDRHR